MSLRIELHGGEQEWDSFVRSSEGWTPYHLSSFTSAIESVHGHSTYRLAVRDDGGALRGILPLTEVKSRLFGHFLISAPFVNYGGPLGDREAVMALGEAAASMAEERGADLLELRAPRELPLDLHASHRKITVLLDLPEGDTEALWSSFRSKVRSQVRRPMKEGMEVSFGPDQLGAFYEVFARHMRDLGTPVQPKRLFERLSESFGDMMWFGCVHADGLPVAAGCGFRWESRFELVWASALREYSRSAPNMLLYWRFMERCVERDVEVFDFGRCTPGSGTHRFKSQWGGRDRRLWWYQHGPRAGGGTPSPDSGIYAAAARTWSRLPIPVANLLGPRIVRYIP